MHFLVLPLRCEWVARPSLEYAGMANRIRGALGAALRQQGCPAECPGVNRCTYGRRCTYATFFDPRWADGPSGYRDAPRPFVLRCNPEEHSVNLFLFQREPPLSELKSALTTAMLVVTGQAPVRFECAEKMCLPLSATGRDGFLRLRFGTPTDLKSAGKRLAEPIFSVMFERLAERVRALGRRYQSWPADVDFAPLVKLAHQVGLINYEWRHSESKRRSARSGKVHAVGGFEGWAEYAGPVGALIPLLEIGGWTGVGRQTVWGNGELRVEEYRCQPLL